jgi:hypothetical protein
MARTSASIANKIHQYIQKGMYAMLLFINQNNTIIYAKIKLFQENKFKLVTLAATRWPFKARCKQPL